MDESRESLLAEAKIIRKEREFRPEQFSCVVCINILKDPVTIPCGHTFCSECVQSHWDGEDGQPRYTCPQCGQSFSPRPVLVRNPMLEMLLERVKKGSEGWRYAAPEDVVCDVCTRKKLKAAKTCMGCRISYCESHLRDHTNSKPNRNHKLVEPGINLKENVCPIHHEFITMYCRTDHQIVCPRCAARLHKGHKIISATAKMKKRKASIVLQQEILEQRLQHHEEELNDTELMDDSVSDSADREATVSTDHFFGLICMMERRHSEVEQEIRAQRASVQKFQENLEQEISQMKRLQAELDSLSLTQDPGQFLLKYKHLSPLKEEPQSSSTLLLHCFKDITEALSDLPDKLQTCPNMGLALTQNNLLMRQPTSREEFLKYAINITMDPNTVHKRLVLSEENRKITIVKIDQDYPDHPERFSDTTQVLSSQALMGRCYFEVQWSKRPSFLGFTYKSIVRKGKGKECGIGMNGVSWALFFAISTILWHNGEKARVSNPRFYRIGVFLDHTAGIVSFYSVNHKEMYQFGKIHAVFLEPLYVAGRFSEGNDSFEFLKLK